MMERLATYHQEIAPVIEHYRLQSRLLEIEGDKAPEEVLEDTLRRLGTLVDEG